MNELRPSYLASEEVAQAVLRHLWGQRSADTSSLHLTGSPLLLQKLWSTLYFLSVIDSGERRELVAKIAHFPDQTTPELSWQSEELLIRGQREFDTITRVFNHFANQPDPLLSALYPRAYLPEINALVTDFISGRALFDECLTLRHLLTPQGQGRAEQVMHRVGRWLRWFHHLPLENIPPERVFSPSDSLQLLLSAVDKLRTLGIDPSTWPRWQQTIAALQQVVHNQQVWTHGDFHLRNVLVVFPNDTVVGLDTALERVDSPYYDLGKFIADLKTRRGIIMRRGLLPPARVIQALIRAFLSGYLAGEKLDVLPLALYEGRFIFQKWVESLGVIQSAFAGRAAPLGAVIRLTVVNPVFRRIVENWMRTVNTAALF